MGLDSAGLLVVNGPHFDNVLQLGKRSLDFTEFFVNCYSFQRRQIRLLGLNQVFAFQGLFLLEVDWMFKVAEPSVFELPIVVSSSVMASQDAGGRGPNLFRGFQFACGDSLFEGLQFLPHPLHGFFAFSAFVAHALIAVNHKHSHSGLV